MILYLLLIIILTYGIEILSINTKYDKSINLFSSDGELIQVLYAEIAGRKGSNVITLTTNDNNILTVIENINNNDILLDKRTIDKITKINNNIWLTFSGLSGDGRYIIINARSFCNEYYLKFGSLPSISAVAKHIGDLQHKATITGNERPLGVVITLFGKDDAEDVNSKPKIFSIKPSGQVIAWKAYSIGKSSDKIIKWLENNYNESLSLNESIDLSIKCLESFQDPMNDILTNNTRKYDLYYLSSNVQGKLTMKVASYNTINSTTIDWRLRDDINSI